MSEQRPPLPHRMPTPVGHSRELSEQSAGEWAARHVTGLPVGRLHAFSLEMLRLHRLVPVVPGFFPMCSCKLPARHCEVIRAEHELLNIDVPFTFDPPQFGAWS